MSYEIPANKKLITPDDPALEYMGRIDFGDPSRPVLIWPGTMIDVNFTGTSCAFVIKNINHQELTHFGALVDGVMRKFFLKNSGEDELYTLAEGLENTTHTLKLVKTLASHNYVEFAGIVVDKDAEAVNPAHRYELKLEVYGDSVSAGENVEDIYFEGHLDDPEHHVNNSADNAYFSYPLMLARRLNAEIHDVAQGGIALLDGTGFFTPDHLLGMVSCYDKLAYSPYEERKQWDFSLYTPDIVIIAIGQNDHQPDPDCIKRPDHRRMWKDKYIGMLRDLMGKYPNAEFILTLTVLKHERTWDDAVREVAEEIADERVRYFEFTRGGKATDGHPRATEQSEMATELFLYIQNTMHLVKQPKS